MSKLDGPGADKEAVSQQLATVQQQIEQVRGENEELRTFFQEALQASARTLCCIWHAVLTFCTLFECIELFFGCDATLCL